MTQSKDQDLIATIRSGVIHIEFIADGKIIASGSGFMSEGYLITNNHVFKGPTQSNVKLTWHSDGSTQERKEIIISYTDFQKTLKSGSDEKNHDYAILDVPKLSDKNLYNFTLASHKVNKILDEVLILGFPLEHQNLVCHKGIISSFYTNKTIDIIQLDASVNASNSGGPLVDSGTGNVIGIVTRKGTGLSKLFDELLASFDQNITALNQVAGMMSLGSVDPIRVLITNQHQMKRLAFEIERSANVGIGYAFSVENIKSEIERLNMDKNK